MNLKVVSKGKVINARIQLNNVLEKKLIKYSGMKKEEIRKTLEKEIPYLLERGKVGLVVGLVRHLERPIRTCW